MSGSTYDILISEQHLRELGYCMIALATTFTAARFGIRTWKRRWWIVEDVLVFSAWSCFTAMAIGYICVTAAVYRIARVGNGEIPTYTGIVGDTEFLLKIFFPGTLLLWTTLWLVKFSLLMNCRRLIERRRQYIIIWWCIVVFCTVVYIGCVISEFTSCRSLKAWFTVGECRSERDGRAAQISLFYSFAVDVLTDFMIMAFPLRILWNLQLSPLRKYSIMSIFGVGTICIIASIVRVIQVGAQSDSKQPSPSWLICWAVIEASIAVIVACLPTFGLLLPPLKTSRPAYGYTNSYGHSKSGVRDKMQKEGIVLRGRGASQHGLHEPVIEANASHERLKMFKQDGVLVTTTLNVDEPRDRSQDSFYHREPMPEPLPERHAGHIV